VVKHALLVNGTTHALEIAPHTLLIDALRDHCGLKGTNQGCDTAQCGACTVLADGNVVKSCNVLAVQIAPQVVLKTIEGVADANGALHPMQVAFSEHHGLQCGYCTPGMIVRGIAMEKEGVPAEADAVRHALAGNICRCTGYEGIVNAICAGLKAMRDTLPPPGGEGWGEGVGGKDALRPHRANVAHATGSRDATALSPNPSPPRGRGT
jgi:aerobic carbon-monoxide dehydrogenase small subunit